jgi:hypothetical protein
MIFGFIMLGLLSASEWLQTVISGEHVVYEPCADGLITRCVIANPDFLTSSLTTMFSYIFELRQPEDVCICHTEFPRWLVIAFYVSLFLPVGMLIFWWYESIRSAYYLIMSPLGNGFLSWYIRLLHTFSDKPMIKSQTMRSTFANAPEITSRVQTNHSHPDAALGRNNSAAFIDNYGSLTGLIPYYLQTSAADERLNREGARTYHWGKDLATEAKEFDPKEGRLLSIVDVDMYLDMPYFLSNYRQPYLISTFQPTALAKSEGEYQFTFCADNQVKYSVSGGAEYKHLVWNYAGDTLVAKSTTWWGLHRYTTYSLDRRQYDDHHQLILLSPVDYVSSWLIPLDTAIGTNNLSRLSVAVKATDGTTDRVYTRMQISRKTGKFTCTGCADTYLSAVIPSVHDDGLASTAHVSAVKLTVAQVKTIMKDLPQEQAVLLTEYHRAKTQTKVATVYPVNESIYRYQFTPKNFDPDAKPAVTPYMSPLILGCYAPDKCVSNDQQAIEGRVTSVKSVATITSELLKYMNEFAAILIPTPKIGVPEDYDCVFEKQHRPAQLAILNQASVISQLTVKAPVSSFMKPETYAKPTDPRNISTIAPVNKMNYSRFMYAFTKVLRATKWYAFGKTPKEIAERVADICWNAQKDVKSTDLSRFDGRVAPVLRNLEQILMVRYFMEEFTSDLVELAATQQNQRGYTSFGIKYETGTSRLSGSPETADLNSVDNAFLAYVANRRTKVNGIALTPIEAYAKLGIYGGDDGLSADTPADLYVTAATDLGQVLECETIVKHCPGVNFLARLYSPDVWEGAPDSMCDLKRQLTKLHVAPKLGRDVTPLDKLREKLVSFSFTDSNTPIMAELCATLFELEPELKHYKLGNTQLRGVAYSHAIMADTSEQYPNALGEWMKDIVRETLPNFDMDAFLLWTVKVLEGNNAEALLKAPLFVPDDIKHAPLHDMVIANDVVKAAVSAPVKPPEPVKRLCTAFSKGQCKFADKCKFVHDSSAVSSSSPVKKQGQDNASGKKSEHLCRMYLKDKKCTFGSDCRFKH